MAEEHQPCAICGANVPFSARYPHYVCPSCVNEATDESGRPLEFFIWNNAEGFIGRYRDTGDVREQHDCIIRGIRCWAGEAYMGGIVVRLPYAGE
jgi:hypothetical protein